MWPRRLKARKKPSRNLKSEQVNSWRGVAILPLSGRVQLFSWLANEGGNNLFVTSLVKGNFQLVTIHMHNIAHAEFLMENPRTRGEFRSARPRNVAISGFIGHPLGATLGHPPPSRTVAAALTVAALTIASRIFINTIGGKLCLRCPAKGNSPSQTLNDVFDDGFRR
jgi:hypothetical protein